MSAGPAAPTVQIVRDVGALRRRVGAWRAAGERTALTPTMGALHEGHLALLELARGRGAADRIVASIFVNPAQFGAGEDFDAYPRDEARDLEMLAEAGCDLVFAPSAAEMYPDGFATAVRVGGLTEVMDGAARPGHFDGVALVVAKLLIQAGADVAVFGEKDFQQLAVIRRLTADLDIPCEILGAPTVREPDGLAMSSRNRYLTAQERAAAPALHGALLTAARRIAAGEPPEPALQAARDAVLNAGFAAVDYIEARRESDLAALRSSPPQAPARVFGAAKLGAARLIDNVPIEGGRP